jgi:3',5'-nucleoside bisphosphate phosphatase
MKNFFKNIKEEDYYSKVNLHIHSSLSDGRLNPSEIIAEAKKQHLEIISITDHNTLEAYKTIDNKNSDGLKIITGIEFDCWHDMNMIHILGYEIDINNEKLNNLCSKDKLGKSYDFVRFFNRRKAADVINAVKNAGGVAVLAHPASYLSFNLRKLVLELKELGLDGLEVYYPYSGHKKLTKIHSKEYLLKLANELDLIVTGGSDCHGCKLDSR